MATVVAATGYMSPEWLLWVSASGQVEEGQWLDAQPRALVSSPGPAVTRAASLALSSLRKHSVDLESCKAQVPVSRTRGVWRTGVFSSAVTFPSRPHSHDAGQLRYDHYC